MDSDADKIRAKRLAKLGGQSSNTSASAASSSVDATNVETPAPTTPSKDDGANVSQQQQPRPQASIAEPKKSTPQITVRPRPASPAKRERDGSERPRPTVNERPAEDLATWQDRTLRQVLRVTLKSDETRDAHGHELIFLSSTKDDLAEQNAANLLSVDHLDTAITEAAVNTPAGKKFEYLLNCFKRVARATRSTKFSGPQDPKHEVLRETKRLCMSYCIFAVTIPEMFNDTASATNPLVQHLLADPESDLGICTDFLTEASSRFEEDDSIKDAIVGAAENLSSMLAQKDMLSDYQNYVRALRNLVRFPKIVDAITQSPRWAPEGIQAQEIEKSTLLGPFFRISPMQQAVASNYFSAPKTRDRSFIANAQNAIRMTLKTHQHELFQIVDTIVRSGAPQRERMLQWFALCVNTNHKKRAMRVDYRAVSSDGFMVNVTTILDQLCEPFMDAAFGKIEKIDVDYLRRKSRVDISDETKMNMDQKTSDEFFGAEAEGTNNFISEVFFLTVASHHYGTEAAQTRMSTLQKTAKRMEKDIMEFEKERHKFLSVSSLWW
jgi:ubiquitin conjugation factor E4 B